MDFKFSDSARKVQPCFVREIQKYLNNPKMISFAGGNPNPSTFPINEISNSTVKVLTSNGNKVMQYSCSEGEEELRKFIAERYKIKHGINVSFENIIITSGAQQGLSLLCKIFLNSAMPIVMENPGYLGAIQVFDSYQAKIHTVPLNEDGIDIEILDFKLKKYNPIFLYSVPEFNNPTGITYSYENKKKIAELMKKNNTLFIEDNPYNELRFMGNEVPLMKKILPEKTILLGSFSKIISPAMRLGWLCASEEIIKKLVVMKQATDLHTNSFSQNILLQYITDYDLDKHIEKIKHIYKNKCNLMIKELENNLPYNVKFIKPEGGMFVWLELPENISSRDIFEKSINENVIFIPGDSFYAENVKYNTIRLNYTNSSDEDIINGIKKLSNIIKKFIL